MIVLRDITKIALLGGYPDRAIRFDPVAFKSPAAGTPLYIVFFAVLTFFLGISLSTAGYSAPHKNRSIIDKPLVELKADQALELFVHANVEFTLLHELAHMFFDLYEVPLLGSEENAADRVALAAILNSATAADGYTAEQKLLAVASNWHADWESMQELQRSFANSDSHSQEIERANIVACFVYGSDPDRYADLIYSRVMPFKRYTECEDEYEQALKSIAWLERHYSRRLQVTNIAETGFSRPVKISVVFDPIKKMNRKAAIEYILEKYKYERFSEFIETKYNLPKDVKIVFGMCRGHANAAWNSVYKEVTICYELINRFFDMYELAKLYLPNGCKHHNFRRILEPFFDCASIQAELTQPKK
ncbi:MAG: DUF4344 domain-containing metallopeptidase [Pseudomonadales bacterium]|nr:DUF4344 domain-containing metallopeptidase [Pseudomonadales bacterium]